MKVKVYKIRENAKLPERAHETDAGFDVCYCPEQQVTQSVLPLESVILPTGLKVEIPEGTMLEVKNKSGLATKNSLVVGACVIDRGYSGEVFINLHNIGGEIQVLEPGQKIAQVVFIKIETPTIDEINADEIYGAPTDRGPDGFGSTGSF